MLIGASELHRQIGDGLTDVAVVVHDLRHGEALKQQVVPVQHRAVADLRARRQAEAQRVDQLIQEQRDAVIDLRLRSAAEPTCVATFALQRLMISSRFSATNSWSMASPSGIRRVETTG